MTDFFWVGLAVGLPVGAILCAVYFTWVVGRDDD